MFFLHCRVGLPVGMVGFAEAKMVTYLLPVAPSGPLVAVRGLGTEKACLH